MLSAIYLACTVSKIDMDERTVDRGRLEEKRKYRAGGVTRDWI